MAKFVINKSSGSGTATIKVNPDPSNDTSKVNYGILKVYKKGNDGEKELVTQVNLTQKAKVKTVITYHLELWNSDGSKKLLSLTDNPDGDTYSDTLVNWVGMGSSFLGTNTYILKSYKLTKKGDTVISKEKLSITPAFSDNYIDIDYSDTYNTAVSIDETKLVIKNTKYGNNRTVNITIEQGILDDSNEHLQYITVNSMVISLKVYDKSTLPVS